MKNLFTIAMLLFIAFAQVDCVMYKIICWVLLLENALRGVSIDYKLNKQSIKKKQKHVVSKPQNTEILKECTHPEQSYIIVNVACTCEEIHTVCDVCHEVLNKRTEC